MIMKSTMLVMVYMTSMSLMTYAAQASLTKPGCQERCGNITVPYPYGMGAGCYLHKSLEVLCNESSEDHFPLRFVRNHLFSISYISMESIRVFAKPVLECSENRFHRHGITFPLERHFTYSHQQNTYLVVGCDIVATFQLVDTSGKDVECSSLCLMNPPLIELGTCMDINGCCRRNLPIETREFSVLLSNIKTISTCVAAFIVEKGYHPRLFTGWEDKHNYPMVLNWVVGFGTCYEAQERGDSLCGQNSLCVDTAIGHGYNCRCLEGYKGNPYLLDGCKGINKCLKYNNHSCRSGERCVNTSGSYECILPHQDKQIVWGTIATLGVLSCFSIIGYWAIKLAKRKVNRIKHNFSIRNASYQLKQKILANRSSEMKIKIYTAKEMKKATEGFSRKRFLGKGGQGTVYKGLLADGTVVAIKRLNEVDEENVAQFMNELLILSQINHRNIVKLLGCCLEYEAPLLVYEYLSNGTLSHHLHDGAEVSKFSWKDRIRIAREIAGALAYLHSNASLTIFHRDIKPFNILFDENYKVVVSDFGLSMSVPFSRTHLSTRIEGTFGYLDPEYFRSGKFTAKSDVYAFGVVLTELITRRKSVSSRKCSEETLIPQFKHLMKHNRVSEILDKQVVQEASVDNIVIVTKLAKICMTTNAKKRPTMKEVVANLDRLMLDHCS